MAFADVALPLPLRQTFTYRVPEALAGEIAVGMQVEAPFRGRARRGWVVGLQPESGREALDLARVLAVPPLSPHLMALARWVSDYYVAPLGMVIAAMLPGGPQGFAASRARKAATEDPVLRLAIGPARTLTGEQGAALQAIESAIPAGAFAPFLIHGVTGSGKTEVYLRAAAAARESGGQALVLVPEVALGAQVMRAFQARFRGRIGVLHSYLPVAERRRNWELARRGALDVVVGARSAVFAPLPALRLIVVDEEHEPAYKQSEQLRYHGRDTAIRRAQMLGIPVVLGSATPSLESRANAARGRYRKLTLTHRVDGRPMPRMRVVDLRHEPGDTLLSATLRAALAERLVRREQAILFLNRRGHSHHTQCRACGWVAECPHCDIALTLHVAPPFWRCHYCEHERPAGARCPECSAELLRHRGSGTQRAERELLRLAPDLRVLRLDTDVARQKGQSAAVLAAFARGEADVLLGTQMIAKGFHFPRVTLVGVLDADVALHLPDFRAAERTYQLLTQVAGRAGRGAVAGEVIIQTCTPDHPAITAAILQDESGWVKRELAERKELGYPPFRRIASLRFQGKDETRVEAEAMRVAGVLRENPGEVEVLGPAPQALAKLRGQHRWHLLLKSESAKTLGEAVRRGLGGAEDGIAAKRGTREVRVVADVDPVDVL